MRRRLSWFLPCVFIFLFLVIFPINANAKEYTSDYYSISEQNIAFNVGDVNFYSIKFITSANSVGLVGGVYNGYNYQIDFKTVVYFYTMNKELIGSSEARQYVPSNEENTYNNIGSINALDINYGVNDIAYFRIKVETNSTNSTSNISSSINTIGNGEYALTKYRIDIKVNENNTFLITEYITAYFNVDKHGIFRKIPLRNEVVRLDGTKSYNRAKISDIAVSGDQSDLYTESGYRVIKIGNPNYTLKGSRDYVISYLYNIGKDTGKGYDEFYFNLIGYEWDTTVSGIEFTITMPKDFDSSKLGFSSGPQGSTDSSNVIYEVNGNVITGSYNGVLKASEALTVRLELPDGYFVGASSNYDLVMLLSIVVPVIFAGIAFVLWIRYGKDEKAIETVEFYHPEGFNSAEVGFIYKGIADKTEVVSLLIYLANKGYIRIDEYDEKTLFSTKKSFKIIKIKDYDGNNTNERLFLVGLFKDKMSGVPSFASFKELVSTIKNPEAYAEKVANTPITEKQEVTSADLQNNFYVTLNAILANINSKENKHQIFEKVSLSKKIKVALMMIISFLLISVRPTIEYGGLGMIPVLIFPIVGFSIMLASFFGGLGMPKLVGILFGVMFGLPWFFTAVPAIQYDPTYLPVFIVGIICIIIMALSFKYMPKRTIYGNEMLGKIRGFKNFLETAEKPKLEALVLQDPKYFYDILPYTYVLGVSDKWIKKFEAISLRAPDWYSGSSAFNMATFGNFMSSTMTSASNSMSSSPSSSGSGGGSSGGGPGGGGGGSW